MKLWIRSQDKEMISLVKTLFIEDINDDNKLFAITDGYVYYGEYNSKERAIEVLDEIQNFMRNYACVIKTNRLGEEIDLIPKPILIYNMPKD